MSLDLKWLLTADDKATPTFDKLKQTGTTTCNDISSAVDGLASRFNMLPAAIGAAAGVAAGMGFKSVINDTVNWDLSVAKLSNTLGGNLEDMSAFSVALNTIGVDQDTAQSAALRLAKTMTTNQDIFDSLGVSVKNANGSYRDGLSVMMEVNQKLADLPAGFDRNTIAMQLYNRSWADVQSLLKLTPQLFQDSSESAHEMGRVVTQEGVAASKQYKMALNELHEAGDALKTQLGSELLPMFAAVGKEMAEDAPKAVHIFGEGLKAARDNSALLELGLAALVAPRIMTGLASLAGGIEMVTGAWAAMEVAAAANPVAAALIIGGAAVYTGINAMAKPANDQASAQLAADQKSLEGNTTRLNAKLKELGFSSWTEFDKAQKAGKVVFDNMNNTWQMKESPNPQVNKDKLALMDKELAAYKAHAEAQSSVTKEQAAVQEELLKSQYEQGEVSTSSYYKILEADALDSAQRRVDIAEEYLSREKDVMDFVRATFGDGSQEYQAEKAKEEQAVKGVQEAELAYAKAYLSSEQQMRQALQNRVDGYEKEHQAYLEASGQYVESENIRYALEQRSLELLHTKADALAGDSAAVQALTDKETQHYLKEIEAMQRQDQLRRQYADNVFSLQEKIAGSDGKNNDVIAAESALHDEINKKLQFQDQLELAKNSGAISEYKYLTQMIPLEDQRIIQLQKQLDLMTKKAAINQKDGNDQIIVQDLINKGLDDEAFWLQKKIDYRQLESKIQQDQIDYDNQMKVAIADGNAELVDQLNLVKQIKDEENRQTGYAISDRTQTPTGQRQAPGQTSTQPKLTGNPFADDPFFSTNYSTGVVFHDVNGKALKSYDVGTPYVPQDMIAKVHKGERIVTAADNAAGKYGNTSVTFGDLHVTLPNVTNQTSAADLARQLFPELKRLMTTRTAA